MRTESPSDATLLATIRGARRLVCITHVDPDADGLGSQLGFCRAARNAGIDAVIVNDDPCPIRYRWLDGKGDVGDFDANADQLDGADLALLFDAN